MLFKDKIHHQEYIIKLQVKILEVIHHKTVYKSYKENYMIEVVKVFFN